MSRPQYPASLLLLLSFASFTGCKRKSTPPLFIPAATPATVPAHPPSFYAQLSDDALVRLNQRAGLGIGLKIAGSTLSPMDPLRFHLVVEDLSATQPIASGLCSGLTLTMENLATQESLNSQIENRSCIGAVPDPDETPLTRGRLRTFDFTQLDAPNLTIPPGTYLAHLTWTAYPAGRPTLAGRPPYATLNSNPVQVKVKVKVIP